MAADPVISVVVATYRRPERVGALLDALARQDVDEPFEVVLVDDGSPADEYERVERAASTSPLEVRVVRSSTNAGPAAARNHGWRTARAPLVAFTDDDCRPTPGWLRALLHGLATADLVQGVTLPDPAQVRHQGPFGRTLRETREGLYPTCNVAYRRDVLGAVGGFDEHLRAGEDTDLAWRARERGATTAFAPDALVHHDVHPSNYRAYLAEKRRWSSLPLVVRRHPVLRDRLHSRWFWRAAHPRALLAGTGLAVLAVPGGDRATRAVRIAVAVSLLVPYVRFRTRIDPLPCGPRRRVALLPLVLAGDLYEVAVVGSGAVRHRCLVL